MVENNDTSRIFPIRIPVGTGFKPEVVVKANIHGKPSGFPPPPHRIVGPTVEGILSAKGKKGVQSAAGRSDGAPGELNSQPLRSLPCKPSELHVQLLSKELNSVSHVPGDVILTDARQPSGDVEAPIGLNKGVQLLQVSSIPELANRFVCGMVQREISGSLGSRLSKDGGRSPDPEENQKKNSSHGGPMGHHHSLGIREPLEVCPSDGAGHRKSMRTQEAEGTMIS